MLKKCAEPLDKPLGTLFKIALDEGSVSMELQGANIMPVFNKDDRKVVTNEHDPQSSERQYGFRKKLLVCSVYINVCALSTSK